MNYKLQFAELLPYWNVLLQGLVFTIVLTVVSTVAGIAVGTAGASARTFGPVWLGRVVAVYVELIRNTPFIVQLFFIFFGLPALGLKLSETTAAFLAMVINLGAYSTEIIRAGIEAVPKGHIEAGLSLAMTKWEVLRRIVLNQAFRKIYPALSSQIIIVMLGSAVVSQISAEDLTYAANFRASRNFRNFEVYLLAALAYLVLAMLTRALLRALGRVIFKARGAMLPFSFWDILSNLLIATQWTIVLSLIAFLFGGIVGLILLFMRTSQIPALEWFTKIYIEFFQGTPLLMQLFLFFFGIALFGIEVSPWTAATLALTFWTSAFLTEIWRGCVESIPKGQWEASSSLALSYIEQMRYVILPQASRIAIAPTVGFSVQVIKGTALASIIGFVELTKAGTMLNNATFRPFLVYSLVALIYFCLCFPLSWWAKKIEGRLNVAR